MKHNIYTPEFFTALINHGSNPTETTEQEVSQEINNPAGPSTWKILFDLLSPAADISR